MVKIPIRMYVLRMLIYFSNLVLTSAYYLRTYPLPGEYIGRYARTSSKPPFHFDFRTTISLRVCIVYCTTLSRTARQQTFSQLTVRATIDNDNHITRRLRASIIRKRWYNRSDQTFPNDRSAQYVIFP
jgi:hypothetical protein